MSSQTLVKAVLNAHSASSIDSIHLVAWDTVRKVPIDECFILGNGDSQDVWMAHDNIIDLVVTKT